MLRLACPRVFGWMCEEDRTSVEAFGLDDLMRVEQRLGKSEADLFPAPRGSARKTFTSAGSFAMVEVPWLALGQPVAGQVRAGAIVSTSTKPLCEWREDSSVAARSMQKHHGAFGIGGEVPINVHLGAGPRLPRLEW